MARKSKASRVLGSILNMRPLRLARLFAGLYEQTPGTRTVALEEVDHRLSDHVHALDLESKYRVLGLPEAILGLEVLESDVRLLCARRAAEKLAYHAFYSSGTGRLSADADWFRGALSLVVQSSSPLKSATMAKSFYEAVAFFAGRHAFRLRDVHGVLYPDVDSIDSIFERLDDLAKRAGGSSLMRVFRRRVLEKKKFPYELVLNYSLKHMRRSQSSLRSVQKFESSAERLYYLLRLDQPPAGYRWSQAAYALDETTKRILEAGLVRNPRWSRKVDLDFADFIIDRSSGLKSLSGWSAAKQVYSQTPYSEVAIDLQREWIHLDPNPNKEFGRSLRSSLGGDSNARPALQMRNGVCACPPATGTPVFSAIRKRLECLQQKKLDMGVLFEEYVVSSLSKIGHVYQGGYSSDCGVEGEVDALVESDDGLYKIVFECKAIDELRGGWNGGYLYAVRRLQRGFLKSQEQLTRFEKVLLSDGLVSFSDDPEDVVYSDDGCQLLRVSLSSFSYCDLHRPGDAEVLLRHFTSIDVVMDRSLEVGANVEDEVRACKEKLLENLNSLRQMGEGDASVFERTVFLDVSLLLMILEKCESVHDLFHALFRDSEDRPARFAFVMGLGE